MSFLRDNGLTITLFGLTSAAIAGMAFTGVHVYNHDATLHDGTALNFVSYLASGHFLSALFENWESEFLQMSVYVCLTAFLYQRGSAESRDPDRASKCDEDPACRQSDPAAPWPVRRGGVLRTLYSYSLGMALCALFVLSFVLHLRASAAAATLDASAHGQAAPDVWTHLFSSEFWFECLQNWQSEFLSTLVLVVLSIFLRFRGSPESKAVTARTWQTGK
ncbi:hypothetical protein EHS39_03765 [Ensifer sp. MPMI2T]|nr:hypothetical protein EHS39_03765 [Ensifer sp. MPMI2T]